MPGETLFENAKAKKDRPRMLTAGEVTDALRLRYPKDQFALITEVGNSTGFRCRRHADVIVVGLWPSRGLDIIGIEVKVRRSDWQKELEQPEKAEEIAQYCDRWFLAVGDAEIVKEGELPTNWGLLVPKDAKTLRCAKEAPLLADAKTLDKGFMAAVLRKACEQLTPEADLQREHARGLAEGLKAGMESANWDKERKHDELLRLEKTVKEFEQASGVSIRNAWQIGKIGEAVLMIRNGTYMRERESLQHFKGDLQKIMERVDFTLEKMTPAEQPQEAVMVGRDTEGCEPQRTNL
jgi:hypothetical protein